MSIKQDNNRNEARPPVGAGNRFVDGGIGDPRDHGMAGLRLVVDRVLQSVDGFGGLQFEAAGTSVREIAKHRDEATLLLARVVRDDGRRASRQRHRSAALRLLGHLKATDQVELLLTVAHHEGEPVTTRAAAFDALGMLGLPELADVVARSIDDDDDRIANRAVRALGLLGGPDHLADLERRLDEGPPDARSRALLGAVADLGVRWGVPVAIPEPDRVRRRLRRTAEVDAEGGGKR